MPLKSINHKKAYADSFEIYFYYVTNENIKIYKQSLSVVWNETYLKEDLQPK